MQTDTLSMHTTGNPPPALSFSTIINGGGGGAWDPKPGEPSLFPPSLMVVVVELGIPSRESPLFFHHH